MQLQKRFQPPKRWKYPIDPVVDYRDPTHRRYLLKAWVEAMAYTEEHNQQLRLMNYAIDRRHDGNIEMKIWLAFLWGCCYNTIGPWTIMNTFPSPPQTPEQMHEFTEWYNDNFERMRFDTDCRYRKSKMIPCVQSYVSWLDGNSQWAAFRPMLEHPDKTQQFKHLWSNSIGWAFYGRLSAWNFLEALNLVLNDKYTIDVPEFMLRDRLGSESNRNGAAYLCNREDLITKKGLTLQSKRPITDKECDALEYVLENLFQECRKEFGHITFINRLNFETIGACWFKKFFREKNSRYVGWDAERTWDELQFLQKNWPEIPLEAINEARCAWLPQCLLHERGVQKWKSAHFFKTGNPLHIWCLQQNRPWTKEM